MYAVGRSALLTMLLSAFWVGPFLFNHDYMTDMHYGPRPQRSVYTGDSFWQMFFDQHVALDVVITTLAVIGVVGCVIRRHLTASPWASRRSRRSRWST